MTSGGGIVDSQSSIRSCIGKFHHSLVTSSSGGGADHLQRVSRRVCSDSHKSPRYYRHLVRTIVLPKVNRPAEWSIYVDPSTGGIANIATQRIVSAARHRSEANGSRLASTSSAPH